MRVWGLGNARSYLRSGDMKASSAYKTVATRTRGDGYLNLRPGDMFIRDGHVAMFLYYTNSVRNQVMIIQQGGMDYMKPLALLYQAAFLYSTDARTLARRNEELRVGLRAGRAQMRTRSRSGGAMRSLARGPLSRTDRTTARASRTQPLGFPQASLGFAIHCRRRRRRLKAKVFGQFVGPAGRWARSQTGMAAQRRGCRRVRRTPTRGELDCRQPKLYRACLRGVGVPGRKSMQNRGTV
jgi:hypothetical protein